MSNVIPIHSKRFFSKDEALDLLPVVRRLTNRAAIHLEEFKEQLKFVPAEEPLHKRLRQDMDLVVKRWALKISRLGLEPRGVWLVDFCAQNGWFSWRYDDETVSYFYPHSATPDERSQETAVQPEKLTT